MPITADQRQFAIAIDNLFRSHRYEEVLALLDQRRLGRSEFNEADSSRRAKALLCLGQLSESLREFERLSEVASKRHEREGTSVGIYCYDEIGLLHWLNGNAEGTLEVLHRQCEMISKGLVAYGDSGGGAGPGLRLWYASVTACNSDLQTYSLSYIKDLSRKRRTRAGTWDWLIGVALGAVDLGMAIRGACEIADPAQAVNMVNMAETSPRGLKNEVFKLLFYWATYKRMVGEGEECRIIMDSLANAPDPMPLFITDWFWARADRLIVQGQSAGRDAM